MITLCKYIGDEEKKGGKLFRGFFFFVYWKRGYKLSLNKFRLEINRRFLAAGVLGILGKNITNFRRDWTDTVRVTTVNSKMAGVGGPRALPALSS